MISLEMLEIHLQETMTTVMKISARFTNHLCFPLSTPYSLSLIKHLKARTALTTPSISHIIIRK